MLLTLARTVVSLLAPLPVILLLLSAFVLLLTGKRRGPRAIIFLTITVLTMCGYGFWGRHCLFDLERQYPPLAVQRLSTEQVNNLKYVVVLGNTHVSDPGVPISSQISGSSL